MDSITRVVPAATGGCQLGTSDGAANLSQAPWTPGPDPTEPVASVSRASEVAQAATMTPIAALSGGASLGGNVSTLGGIPVFCERCGAQIVLQGRFCGRCGAPISAEPAASRGAGASIAGEGAPDEVAPSRIANAAAPSAAAPRLANARAGSSDPFRSRRTMTAIGGTAGIVLLGGAAFLHFRDTKRAPSDPSAAQGAAGAHAQHSITVTVAGDQPWTVTGVRVHAGDTVSIIASGGVSFSVGSPPTPPGGVMPNCLVAANGPYGWREAPFVANGLPCASLLGRIGRNGAAFYVGDSATFQSAATGQLFLGVNDNAFGDNFGSWSAAVTVKRRAAVVPGPGLTSGPRFLGPPPTPIGLFPRPGFKGTAVVAIPQLAVTGATVRNAGTSIRLPPGCSRYIYGMATGGAAPSGPFAIGPYAEASNASGQLAVALAYGNVPLDSYSTQTGYQVTGGVAVTGRWNKFTHFYGSNSRPGASHASVDFRVWEKSLVVFIGLASSQQSVILSGIPGLRVDASGSTDGMVIAHAYLRPGEYSATEHSAALAGGQDPNHMADLIGVFVFGAGPNLLPLR